MTIDMASNEKPTSSRQFRSRTRQRETHRTTTPFFSSIFVSAQPDSQAEIEEKIRVGQRVPEEAPLSPTNAHQTVGNELTALLDLTYRADSSPYTIATLLNSFPSSCLILSPYNPGAFLLALSFLDVCLVPTLSLPHLYCSSCYTTRYLCFLYFPVYFYLSSRFKSLPILLLLLFLPPSALAAEGSPLPTESFFLTKDIQ